MPPPSPHAPYAESTPVSQYMTPAITPTQQRQRARRQYRWAAAPPSTETLLSSLNDHGIPRVVNEPAIFSDIADVPPRPALVQGQYISLHSNTVHHLPLHVYLYTPHVALLRALQSGPHQPASRGQRVWAPSRPAPSPRATRDWLRSHRPQSEAKPRGEAARWSMDPNTGRLLAELPGSQGADASQGSRGRGRADEGVGGEEEEEEEELRPASPKYDEPYLVTLNFYGLEGGAARGSQRSRAVPRGASLPVSRWGTQGSPAGRSPSQLSRDAARTPGGGGPSAGAGGGEGGAHEAARSPQSSLERHSLGSDHGDQVLRPDPVLPLAASCEVGTMDSKADSAHPLAASCNVVTTDSKDEVHPIAASCKVVTTDSKPDPGHPLAASCEVTTDGTADPAHLLAASCERLIRTHWLAAAVVTTDSTAAHPLAASCEAVTTDSKADSTHPLAAICEVTTDSKDEAHPLAASCEVTMMERQTGEASGSGERVAEKEGYGSGCGGCVKEPDGRSTLEPASSADGSAPERGVKRGSGAIAASTAECEASGVSGGGDLGEAGAPPAATCTAGGARVPESQTGTVAAEVGFGPVEMGEGATASAAGVVAAEVGSVAAGAGASSGAVPRVERAEGLSKRMSTAIGGGKRKTSAGGVPGGVSQITPPTPTQTWGQAGLATQTGFALSGGKQAQQVTVVSLEVQAACRGEMRPDPAVDPVQFIVLAVHDDATDPAGVAGTTLVLIHDSSVTTPAAQGSSAGSPQAHPSPPRGSDTHVGEAPQGGEGGHEGGDAVGRRTAAGRRPRRSTAAEGQAGCEVLLYPTEEALLRGFLQIVQEMDPDIVMGWEVHAGSLGYLHERACAALSLNLLRAASRVPELPSRRERADEYGESHASGIHLAGRVVLNLWRLLRSEVKLGIYTFENCVAAVLRHRVPHVPAHRLARWFTGAAGSGGRARCVEYLTRRAQINLQLVDHLDLLNRTAELARLFGIEFYSVLSRGSQYRVESMLLRLAHTQNFLMLSPSKAQVNDQPAMECLPLVMEPQSRLYTDPMVVLDFQSLYPSQMIAYNLCYSTCLGRVPPAGASPAAARTLGAAKLSLPPGTLAKLAGGLTITPNGVLFAPPEVRRGVLPRLLNEILNTRIMVKAAMKRAGQGSAARVLQRVLNSRQFGLKLIANVTYGYTAAGFSGRMPCAELADSIVQSGRATLERAIEMIESNQRWGGRVVYGDTDSLFVHLPGRTRQEAFQLGAEMAAAVTAANPAPVCLKLEKVYQPCVLVTKKRYVGMKYEGPKQTVGSFEAKGIETVRRDTCPVVAKVMEKSLRLLFQPPHDLSRVKAYLQRQWGKTFSGRVSAEDFVFAKEVRLGTYSDRYGLVPPAAIVAGRAMAKDPRAAPQYGERVPYVVVCGEPGARLVDLVVDPHALLDNPGTMQLHAVYYITKHVVPSLQRILGLAGANVLAWYTEMPRTYRARSTKRPPGGGASALGMAAAAGPQTIDLFYLSQHCAVCDALTTAAQAVCPACLEDPQVAMAVLMGRSRDIQRLHQHLVAICQHCGGGSGLPRLAGAARIACDSLDCPVFFQQRKVEHERIGADHLVQRVLAMLASR
ncbi:hypothetical protein CYMTET_52186 [Cymbomonas tetramitiformis]|uniref:DNA polymerase n=1 Tax=Cymbomonas tetramitiformis TaxID=36881 RepID=A0AAE0BJH4_9CHLO|nr:hypothetical protein CYMTET_52186 [Cymbomonas tetramitiformis]